MEVTKWLKPSISVSRIGDSASVQAATRVNAEQASHDEGLVKGSRQGDIEKSPVCRYSEDGAQFSRTNTQRLSSVGLWTTGRTNIACCSRRTEGHCFSRKSRIDRQDFR
jgi:hypothetical protein